MNARSLPTADVRQSPKILSTCQWRSFDFVPNLEESTNLHVRSKTTQMSLKLLAKGVARAVLPTAVFEKQMAARSRRFQLRGLKNSGLIEITTRYIERYGSTVRYGPFAGTIYPLEAALSHNSIPKLLGTYEQELHYTIRNIGQRKYDLIVDIGGAEGYYAVGLARLLRTKVLTYDPEPIERSFCEKAARLNAVSQFIELRDLFRASDVRLLRNRRVLGISDCEGFESEIFNASTIHDMTGWDLLIELHGEAAEKLTSLRWPQKVVIITRGPRSRTYVELEGLGDQDTLLSEGRAENQMWLWCDGQAGLQPQI
jgi:hypothetical protein